jgi:hypothetical protein
MRHIPHDERDVARLVESHPEETTLDFERSARTVSRQNILSLQRTIGNKAVVGLIQRQAAPKKNLKAPPAWARTSSNDPLPGEHVQGITNRQAPIMLQDENGNPLYTETDREKLKDALMTRHQENAQNGPDFAANFAGALLEIWTSYVTEDMAKTADEASWDMLEKLVLFALKEAAISFVFAPATLARLTTRVAGLLKYAKFPTAATADLTQDAIENDSVNAKVQKRGRELREMSTTLSANLQEVIRTTFEEVGDSFYYRDWLDNAPLQKLHLFRLPPAIPALPREKIEVMIAQQLVGLINTQEGGYITNHREAMLFGLLGYMPQNYVKNGIFVSMSVDGAGNEQLPDPVLNAPELLAKRLEGNAIGDMPQVPLLIELKCALPQRVYSKDEADAIEMLQSAWPHSAPMEIKMAPGGGLTIFGGGLAEMFYLYSVINPLADIGSLAVLYANGMEGEGIAPPAGVAAVDLYYWFYPHMETAAHAVYMNSVRLLKIPRRDQAQN